MRKMARDGGVSGPGQLCKMSAQAVHSHDRCDTVTAASNALGKFGDFVAYKREFTTINLLQILGYNVM